MYEKKEIGIIFPFHSGIFIFPRIHVEKKIKTDIFYSWYLSHYLEKKKQPGKLRMVVSLITVDPVCVPAYVYTWVCVSFQRTTQIKWKKNQFAYFTVNQYSLSDSPHPTIFSNSFYLSFCPMNL